MRVWLLPITLLSAALPSFAHGHGHGCWHRPGPRVIWIERPCQVERCEPRVFVRHGWYASPRPMWVERREACEDERPVVRFEFNLR